MMTLELVDETLNSGAFRQAAVPNFDVAFSIQYVKIEVPQGVRQVGLEVIGLLGPELRISGLVFPNYCRSLFLNGTPSSPVDIRLRTMKQARM